MREIQASQITDVVEKLCIEANEHLPEDVKCAIKNCRACEDWEIAQGVLDKIIENYEIADTQCVPICQDTGMACVFLEIGQDVHITGGDLADAINEGVRRGYDKGYLRKSVVKDPVRRGNTGDNTPAMIYTEIVPGEQIKITVGPKGFGSENMSAIRMFKPSPCCPPTFHYSYGPRVSDKDTDYNRIHPSLSIHRTNTPTKVHNRKDKHSSHSPTPNHNIPNSRYHPFHPDNKVQILLLP